MKFKFKDNMSGLADLDTVPGDFKAMYVEGEDGTFSVPEQFYGMTSAVDKLNKSNVAIRGERDVLRKGAIDLAPLSEFGESVDDILSSFTTKVDGLSEMVEKSSKINPEKIKQDVAKSYIAAAAEKDGTIQTLTNQLHGVLVQKQLASAITDAKGSAKLLMPHMVPNIKMVSDENGKLEVAIYDEDGDVRMSPSTAGNMSIPEYVAVFKRDSEFGPMFESEQKSGGGSNPAAKGGPGPSAPNSSSIGKIGEMLKSL